MTDFIIYRNLDWNGEERLSLQSYTGPGGDVVIPEGIREIASGAFSGCSRVTSVQLPDSVEVIESRAFEECTSLREIAIPDNVAEIGLWCFLDCKSLERVHLPAALEEVKMMAFTGCTSLQHFALADSNPHFAVADGILYSKQLDTLVLCPTGRSGVVSVPVGVKTIGEKAFRGCEQLQEIRLPEGLEVIGTEAFYLCTGLTDVTLSMSLKRVERLAFSGCARLRKLTVSGPETGLHKHILWKSSAVLLLPAAYSMEMLPKELKKWAFFGQLLRWEEGEKPENEKALTAYLKGQRKRLYADLWQHSYLLRRMLALQIIPEAELDGLLETAQDRKEYETAAQLLEYRTRICSPIGRAAREAEEMEHEWQLLSGGEVPVHWLRQSWNSKKNADGTLCITGWKGSGKMAFLPTKIGKNTVTAIQKEAFSPRSTRCTNLKAREELEQVVLPDWITRIGERAFHDCFHLREVTLPRNLTEIGYGIFATCHNLQKIDLPDGITCIPHMAFRQCHALQEIRLPKGLEIIETWAFCGCSSLKTLILPERVREIRSVAFANCLELEELYIPASVERIERHAFQSCDKLTIHTPKGSLAARYAKENHIPCVEL